MTDYYLTAFLSKNQGCKNCPESLGPVSPFDLPDDYEDGVNIGVAHWCVGSLVVNPGCTFYGYSDFDFEGTVDEYPAIYGDPAGESFTSH